MISIACECKEDITCELLEETMEDLSYKRYPVESEGYKLYEAIGEGYSATVYRALCVPFNEIVAIKVLDLERCNNDLDGIRREVHTMSLIDHPKVLRALCSFSTGHNLWVVMPYMAGGSCLHIMKSYYPEGFEEPVIATLLREALMALEYLHAHGHIHRDVKAGNILLDSNGTVKLADFGVSACMFDRGDRHRARNTFVGTPCWMAPEVMQQAPSYDFRADIWSFGITALELAHGHAPFSKYPPMKVFLMTLQSAPPGLDYERDKRFSKSFKEMVAACLVKDPKKRPSADKLLKHTFFKSAKTQEYLARTILQGLSPLGERYMISKAKDMELLGQNKALHGNEEQISKREYIQGVSAWNFNLEDVKNQAALIQDNESTSSQENVDSYWKQKESCEDVTTLVHRPSTDTTNESNSGPSYENGFDDTDSCKGSLVSFPNQPLQASKGCFDIAEEDSNAKGPSCDGSVPSDSEMQSPPSENPQTRRYDFDSMSTDTPLPQNVIPEQKKNLSGPLLPENVVQHRGRFKVTSADLSPKSSTMGFSIPGSGNSTAQVAQNVSAASIIPSLQLILQQIDMQKEEIIKLITRVEQSSGNPIEGVDTEISDAFQSSPVSGRDGSLKAQVIHLQQRIGSLVEELQRQKLKNAQLERQLSGLGKRE